MTRCGLTAALIFSIAGSILPACSTSSKDAPKAAAAQPAATQPTPAAKPDHPADHAEHALHNVHAVNDRLISGGVPDGDAAFDELKAMGIKTVISVDGATPDIARAEARGMRYVHIPVTYADVSDQQRMEIARAIRDLPGPVYLHCHHGKHRGPAAAASAAIALGDLTPEQGVAFMQSAGTAPNYQGLYACVASATIATPSQLDAASAEFPQVRSAEGMVACMVEVDIAYEHLGEIRTAGWVVPKDHPDLVPAAEAGRLTDNLRFSDRDEKSKALGDDYAAKLKDAIEKASALEESIVRGASKEELEASWKLVAASCKDCHASYRDNVKRSK